MHQVAPSGMVQMALVANSRMRLHSAMTMIAAVCKAVQASSTVFYVCSSLFTSMQEPGLVAAAEHAWDLMAAHPATASAAARMAAHIEATPARAAARLGRSAWNAYSFNVDYRTGAQRGVFPHGRRDDTQSLFMTLDDLRCVQKCTIGDRCFALHPAVHDRKQGSADSADSVAQQGAMSL